MRDKAVSQIFLIINSLCGIDVDLDDRQVVRIYWPPPIGWS